MIRTPRSHRAGKGRVLTTLLDTDSPLVDSTSVECDEIRARVRFVVVSPPQVLVPFVTTHPCDQIVDGCLPCVRGAVDVVELAESANAPAS